METWKRVSQKEIEDWRERRRENLKTKRTRWEWNTAHHTGMDRGTPEEVKSGTATLTAPTATSIRQHRDTVEVAARSMVSWVQEGSKEAFMRKVKMLKQMGNFSHLTDEEAANQLWEIAHTLAEDSARRVYARDGYDGRFWKEPV